MKRTLLLLAAVLMTSASFAQRMKKERLNVQYVQPPTIHLEDGMGFHSNVILDYKAEIDAELATAEEEYQQALAEYPEKEAAAKAVHEELVANYERDLETWNSKGSLGKIIEKKVLENSKPQPPRPYYPPAKPQKRAVSHQKVFNESQLSSTYCRVEGLEEDADGVAIEVHLFGFENDDPVVEKKEFKEFNSKTKQETTVIKSHWVFNYRHSMTLRVVHPNGSIILDEVPNSISDYKKFESALEKRSYPSTNSNTFIEKLQNTSVENNLKTIQWLINDKLGTTEQARDIEVVYVNNKKGNYGDLENAMFDAKEGYGMLLSRPEEAKEKLQSAIQTWEAALEESDMDDKKARINKKVVPDLYNNVILAAILVQDFDKADDHYSATLRLDFANRDESNLKELKLLNDDLRERHEK
tara:strand:+ start:1753 stop:2991 length:1239 start_codon:yes stop_codon:yes gene_type:complete